MSMTPTPAAVLDENKAPPSKRQEIEALIDKAAKREDAMQAMHFTQAALNAANAMCALKTAERSD